MCVGPVVLVVIIKLVARLHVRGVIACFRLESSLNIKYAPRLLTTLGFLLNWATAHGHANVVSTLRGSSNETQRNMPKDLHGAIRKLIKLAAKGVCYREAEPE
jgi:hypothetical protein